MGAVSERLSASLRMESSSRALAHLREVAAHRVKLSIGDMGSAEAVTNCGQQRHPLTIREGCPRLRCPRRKRPRPASGWLIIEPLLNFEIDPGTGDNASQLPLTLAGLPDGREVRNASTMCEYLASIISSRSDVLALGETVSRGGLPALADAGARRGRSRFFEQYPKAATVHAAYVSWCSGAACGWPTKPSCAIARSCNIPEDELPSYDTVRVLPAPDPPACSSAGAQRLSRLPRAHGAIRLARLRRRAGKRDLGERSHDSRRGGAERLLPRGADGHADPAALHRADRLPLAHGGGSELVLGRFARARSLPRCAMR